MFGGYLVHTVEEGDRAVVGRKSRRAFFVDGVDVGGEPAGRKASGPVGDGGPMDSRKQRRR